MQNDLGQEFLVQLEMLKKLPEGDGLGELSFGDELWFCACESLSRAVALGNYDYPSPVHTMEKTLPAEVLRGAASFGLAMAEMFFEEVETFQNPTSAKVIGWLRLSLRLLDFERHFMPVAGNHHQDQALQELWERFKDRIEDMAERLDAESCLDQPEVQEFILSLEYPAFADEKPAWLH